MRLLECPELLKVCPNKSNVGSVLPVRKPAACGARGNRIDVRPNWKEQPVMPTKLRYE